MAFEMSALEKAQVNTEVAGFNAKNLSVNGRTASQQLGKDDFLKLLLSQLSHQDPMSPMENTEFIGQMAQFSSLEQMSNMNSEFTKLASMLHSSEAASMLGKTVELYGAEGAAPVLGVVEGVTRGANPELMIDGARYSMEQIKAIYNN